MERKKCLSFFPFLLFFTLRQYLFLFLDSLSCAHYFYIRLSSESSLIEKIVNWDCLLETLILFLGVHNSGIGNFDECYI